MAGLRRGEIHWAELDPVVGSEPAGRRPVLVLQADPLNRTSTTIALAITSAPQSVGFPLVVEIPRGTGGLRRTSWVKINQIRTLSRHRLAGRIGLLPADLLRQVEDGMLEVLGIDRD